MCLIFQEENACTACYQRHHLTTPTAIAD